MKPTRITCPQCGETAIKTIEITESWGSKNNGEEPVWICRHRHRTHWTQ